MSFAEWYKEFPRKCGKLDAEKAYNAAIKKGATHEQLERGIRAFNSLCASRGTDKAFIPYPASWLRSGAYMDEELFPHFSEQYSTAPILSALVSSPSWNGTASKLIAEIGEAKWQTWFSSTELELGDPATIWARKPSQAVWIRSKYRPQLERILGVNEVRVEVRQ